MSSLGKLIALASWVAVKSGKRKSAVDVENDTDTGFWVSLGRLKTLGGDEVEEEEGGGGGGRGRGDLAVAEALSAITFQPLCHCLLAESYWLWWINGFCPTNWNYDGQCVMRNWETTL